MGKRQVEPGGGGQVTQPSTSVARLEAELAAERKARAEAEEANRRKDEFLAILSHEMRSPLNAVLTWVQVLRSGRVDAATTEQALGSLERSARLQARMIEDLLDTSRIISGKLSLEVQESDLVAIVKNAVDVAHNAASEKQITLESRLDTEHVPMRADPVRLQQVVSNLLSNAVKFTPQGGSIRIALSSLGDRVAIDVSDTGSGISPDLLPHIFDPFRQGDISITRRHGGLGLGLAIARRIVELHGGTIEAESPGEGRGTKFRMCLRLDSAAVLAQTDAGGSRPAQSRALAGLPLLVVDDDPDTCLALATVLREAGARVHCAGSVRDALRSFRHDPAAVVVTDLAMPDSDGYELIIALRAADGGEHVPVIALTGSAGPDDRQRVRDAGFVLHLTKPVDPAEVVSAVQMAASGRAEEFALHRQTAGSGTEG